MTHPLSHIDIHEAIYRYQRLKQQKLDFSVKAFIKEVEIRDSLRSAYNASGCGGSEEEITKAIEVIRRQG